MLAARCSGGFPKEVTAILHLYPTTLRKLSDLEEKCLLHSWRIAFATLSNRREASAAGMYHRLVNASQSPPLHSYLGGSMPEKDPLVPKCSTSAVAHVCDGGKVEFYSRTAHKAGQSSVYQSEAVRPNETTNCGAQDCSVTLVFQETAHESNT